jgi:3-hydroxybutyrate dehydrogenase
MLDTPIASTCSPRASIFHTSRFLAGRTAVVTGSTSGIGLGIAKALACAGANIVLNGLGARANIDKTKDEIAMGYGVTVAYYAADISKPDQVADLVSSSAFALGNIDILVNNAGIQHVAPIEAFPAEKWDQILAIGLSGAFHAMRAAIPIMKAKKWGRIINIASAHGLVASPFKSAYVAAKHGIVGLTKVAAHELAEHGVTVNAVCPGYVWTPLVEKRIGDQAKARGISTGAVVRDVLLAKQATKNFVTVEELAGLVVFLCSDIAASITGTALPVDSGWMDGSMRAL